MSKLRRSAKGQACMIRLPGTCNHNDETTVLAHLGGAGMGIKQPDFLGAFSCSSCHDQIDSRAKRVFDRDYLKLAFFEGMVRTQQYWLEHGFIVVK